MTDISNLKKVGIALLLILMLLPIVVHIISDVYWLFKCLREGGDWKCYAESLACFLWVIGICIALFLILV